MREGVIVKRRPGKEENGGRVKGGGWGKAVSD